MDVVEWRQMLISLVFDTDCVTSEAKLFMQYLHGLSFAPYIAHQKQAENDLQNNFFITEGKIVT